MTQVFKRYKMSRVLAKRFKIIYVGFMVAFTIILCWFGTSNSSDSYSFIKSKPSKQPLLPKKIFNHCSNDIPLTLHTKVLSYTIYGSWATSIGWIDVIEKLAKDALSSRLYHDWVIRLHHDNGLPEEFKQRLMKIPNLQLCDAFNIPYYGNMSTAGRMEWRFLPIGDETVDVMCSRDVDTPLVEREFAAVEQFLHSHKIFHAMRDHPHHGGWQILGGMFCFKNNVNKTLTDSVLKALHIHFTPRTSKLEPPFFSDQIVLRDYINPLVRNVMMEHDSYSCENYNGSLPFPTKRSNRTLHMGCKLPCDKPLSECPKQCRPKDHLDWIYC